jgi:hypothetical protein
MRAGVGGCLSKNGCVCERERGKEIVERDCEPINEAYHTLFSGIGSKFSVKVFLFMKVWATMLGLSLGHRSDFLFPWTAQQLWADLCSQVTLVGCIKLWNGWNLSWASSFHFWLATSFCKQLDVRTSVTRVRFNWTGFWVLLLPHSTANLCTAKKPRKYHTERFFAIINCT